MEILHTVEIMSEGWSILSFLLGIVLVFVIGLGVCFSLFDKEYLKATIYALISIILLSMIIAMVVVPDKITKHKVVITDMESFDFDKYEIISNEGKVFTIYEK